MEGEARASGAHVDIGVLSDVAAEEVQRFGAGMDLRSNGEPGMDLRGENTRGAGMDLRGNREAGMDLRGMDREAGMDLRGGSNGNDRVLRSTADRIRRQAEALQQKNSEEVLKRGPGRPRKRVLNPSVGNPIAETSGLVERDTRVSPGNDRISNALAGNSFIGQRDEVQEVQSRPIMGAREEDSLEREDDLETSFHLINLEDRSQQAADYVNTIRGEKPHHQQGMTFPKWMKPEGHSYGNSQPAIRKSPIHFSPMGRLRVKDLSTSECERFLCQQSVQLINERDPLTLVLEVLKTNEVINDRNANTIEALLDQPLDHIYRVGPSPKVVLHLREKCFEESEIRDLWQHGVTNLHRLEPDFINEVRCELKIGTRAAVTRMLKQRSSSHLKDENNHGVYPYMDGYGRSEVNRSGYQAIPPRSQPPLNQSNQSFGSLHHSGNICGTRSPQKIPALTDREDPIQWLDDRHYQLRSDPCKDEVLKTAIFKCSLSGALREATEKIEARIPDIQWPQLIEELRKSHLPAASLFSAHQSIQFMRYDYSEPFSKWIQKWETALRVTMGPVDEKIKIITLLRALPLDDQFELGQIGKEDSYDAILKYISYKDCRKRMVKESARGVEKSINAHQPQQRSQPPKVVTSSGYQGLTRQAYRPQPRYGLTNATNGTHNERKPLPVEQNKYNNLECYHCQQKGHIAAYCKQKVQLVERDDDTKSQVSVQRCDEDKPTPKASSHSCTCSHINVYQSSGELLPDLDIISGEDEIPQDSYIRQLNSEQSTDTTQSIGQAVEKMDIDPLMRKTFNLKVELVGSQNQVVRQLKAVIDTGADVSLLDSYVTRGLPFTLYPPDSRVTGVDTHNIQLLGFAYLYAQVKETGESSLMKMYIINQLSGGVLLGGNFINDFVLTLKSVKGEREVFIGETPSPTISFKAVEPKDLGQIIEKVEKATGYFHPRAMLQFTGIGEEHIVIDLEQNYDQQIRYIRKLPEEFASWPQQRQLQSIICPELTNKQKKEALDLLWSYHDVFSKNDGDLGYVPPQWTNIKIELDGPPPMQKAYDVSPPKRILFENTIQPLIYAGIVEECTDPGGVPALLVRKPNGKFRLVVDYRIVNARCRKIEHPMPNIDSCLKALAGKKYSFMCDLAQGYHQLGLAPEERAKTVFVTPDRKLRYTRLPMGYVNAPYHFQKLINELLEGLQYRKCIGYFDDLIAMGETWPEFLENVGTLLERLRQYGLKAKPEKCFMGYPVVKLLGHIVDATGIKPNPEKVTALKAMSYPKTKKEMRSMLGLFTFFSRYIPQYAILAQPLFELTAGDTTFKLLENHREAIDALKHALAEDCLLAHFRFELPTKLSCDASNKAIGGILMQEETLINENTKEEEKSWRPITYYSQVLLSHQKNYTVSEKELLGILIGITKFRNYLEGKEFTVETDHHALCQLTKLKFKNGRLNRWSLLLQGFRYNVVYRNGKDHLPDCLSRLCEWDHRKPLTSEEELEDRVLQVLQGIEEVTSIEQLVQSLQQCGELELAGWDGKHLDNVLKVREVVNQPQLLKELAASQQENQQYASIVNDLLHPDRTPENSQESLKLFSLKGDVLYRKPDERFGRRLVLTHNMFKELFNYEHNLPTGGHFGAQKTYMKIRQHYWMPRLFDTVFKACERCNLCAMYKVANRIYSDPQVKGISPIPFGRLELDVQGPFKRSNNGNTCVIVLTDSLSRFAFAKATRDQDTRTVIRFLQEIFVIYGYPRIIQTDQGSNFMSDMFHEFISEHHIAHYISNAYHPEGQGQVERMNRTLGERIKIYADKNYKNWDLALPSIVFSINNTIHGVTKYSPAFLLLGFSPRSPSDQKFAVTRCTSDVHMARAQAYDRLVASQRKTKERLKNSGVQPNYQPGDLVLIRRKASDLVRGKKLTIPYLGPYLVLQYTRGHVKTISMAEKDFGHPNAFNVNITKPFKGTLSPSQKRAFLEHCKLHDIIPKVEASEESVSEDAPLVESKEEKKLTLTPQNSLVSQNAILDSIKRRKRSELVIEDPIFQDKLNHRYNLRPRQVKCVTLFDSKFNPIVDTNIDNPESKCLRVSLESELIGQSDSTSHLDKILFDLGNKIKGQSSVQSLGKQRISVQNICIQNQSANKLRLARESYRVKVKKKAEGVNKANGGKTFSSFPFLRNKSESIFVVHFHLLTALCAEQSIVLCSSFLCVFVSTLVSVSSRLIMAPANSKPLFDCSPQQLVENLIKSEARERHAYKRLIFEKISKTMLSADILKEKYDTIPQPPHGYPRWHIRHNNMELVIKKFLCHLCNQIAKTPVKCKKCGWIYCKQCANYLNLLHPILCQGKKLPSLKHFMCFNLGCPFGTNQPEIELLREEDLKLYQEIHFRCRRVLCYTYGPSEMVFPHEETCPRGPMDWSFDTTLLKNDYGGTFYDLYRDNNPITWSHLVAPALQRASFVFYQRDEARRETLRHWLLLRYPKMDRCALSAHLECSNGWRDGVRQAKYQDGFISELERILQEEYGLPPYIPHPGMEKMNIKPLVPADGSIIYDPETKKYIKAPYEVTDAMKRFRPSKQDRETLQMIQERYGPKSTNELAPVKPPVSGAPHLARYLDQGSKRRAPVSPSKECIPSTSTGVQRPSVQPKLVRSNNDGGRAVPKTLATNGSAPHPSKGTTEPFKWPKSPREEPKRVHWGELLQQDLREQRERERVQVRSPTPSVASTSSFTSGDGHGHSYFAPDEPRPFIRVPIWEGLSDKKRTSMEVALRNINVYMGNRQAAAQPASENLTDEVRKAKARTRNFGMVKKFERRPQPVMVRLDEDSTRTINSSRDTVTNERRVVLSLAMISDTETDADNFHECKPLWVVLMDHTGRVVYETFIKSKELNLHSRCHGIYPDMVAQARPLNVVASQVAEYIAACNVLVGAGLHHHLQVLGFDRRAISRFRCRMRDMTVYYSPRKHQATSLCINALLLFGKQLISPVHPHPQENAWCSMRMYLFEMERIEKMAESSQGIHNLNQHRTSGHPDVKEKLRKRLLQRIPWPPSWVVNQWPRPLSFPTLESISASPPPPIQEDEEEMEFFHYPDGLQVPDPLAQLYEGQDQVISGPAEDEAQLDQAIPEDQLSSSSEDSFTRSLVFIPEPQESSRAIIEEVLPVNVEWPVEEEEDENPRRPES
ncbi:uncharacterized protein LOC141852696 [Brevipalpus obovatus]|uniref:uncharacterized protein LOC141852696 n=1 Tax=Brevipalpus obovatus TaxID=246614 RepID=UPI003D9E8D02